MTISEGEKEIVEKVCSRKNNIRMTVDDKASTIWLMDGDGVVGAVTKDNGQFFGQHGRRVLFSDAYHAARFALRAQSSSDPFYLLARRIEQGEWSLDNTLGLDNPLIRYVSAPLEEAISRLLEMLESGRSDPKEVGLYMDAMIEMAFYLRQLSSDILGIARQSGSLADIPSVKPKNKSAETKNGRRRKEKNPKGEAPAGVADQPPTTEEKITIHFPQPESDNGVR